HSFKRAAGCKKPKSFQSARNLLNLPDLAAAAECPVGIDAESGPHAKPDHRQRDFADSTPPGATARGVKSNKWPLTGNLSFSKAHSSKWQSSAADTWACRWRCALPKQGTKSRDLIRTPRK